MSDELLVLDASPMFNLLGSGSAEVVLASFSGSCIIEEHTLKEIERNPFDNEPAGPAIEKLVSRGFLKLGRMGNTAYEHYLELVSAETSDALGRGESAALAYANEVRGLVVLDDRKARRLGKLKFPACPQITSIDLMRRASRTGSISKRQMAEIIRLAIRNARMHIPSEDRKWLVELGL